MKNKKSNWFLISIISFILLCIFITTIILYNLEITKIKTNNLQLIEEINNKESIIEQNNIEINELNIEKNRIETKNVNLENELNSNLEFLQKYNLILLYISKAQVDLTAANTFKNEYDYYEGLTDTLYSGYNLKDIYDYDYSKSLLEYSIKNYDDCTTNILKINKMFTELPEIKNTYWNSDINLRKKQVNQLNEVCIFGKKLSNSLLNQGYYFYEINNQTAYISELNKYNNELIPKYNDVLENYRRTLKEINVHLNSEVYYTSQLS